jgi:hypothetical protein
MIRTPSTPGSARAAGTEPWMAGEAGSTARCQNRGWPTSSDWLLDERGELLDRLLGELALGGRKVVARLTALSGVIPPRRSDVDLSQAR